MPYPPQVYVRPIVIPVYPPPVYVQPQGNNSANGCILAILCVVFAPVLIVVAFIVMGVGLAVVLAPIALMGEHPAWALIIGSQIVIGFIAWLIG